MNTIIHPLLIVFLVAATLIFRAANISDPAQGSR